jgi:hypothetical protein
MAWASNPSFLPSRKHSFGFEGCCIIQYMQKLFRKLFYLYKPSVSAKQDYQVSFKLKLNTKVYSMWKTNFDVPFLQLVRVSRHSH